MSADAAEMPLTSLSEHHAETPDQEFRISCCDLSAIIFANRWPFFEI